MDFLKKHYEKVALAVVSVLLILSALTLMGKLALGGGEEPGSDSKNLSPAKPLDTNDLTRVAALLKNPLQWEGKGPGPFIPRPWKYMPDGDLLPAEQEAPAAVAPVLDELDWYVSFKTFPMLFMTVAFGEGTNATFQVNIGGRGTEFVKVGGNIRQVIGGVLEEFKVVSYQEKKEPRFNPRTNREQVVDVSALTLQRKGGALIPLVRGEPRLESAPVAYYISRVTGERSGELKKGSAIQYKGKRFKVIDITTRRVVIEDSESGTVHEKSPRIVQGQ